MRLFVLSCIACLFTSVAMAEESWPQFRGPTGQGHSKATGVPIRWSEKQNVLWKTPLPGLGWSSPVVRGSQIWMTTAIEKKASKQQLLDKLVHKGRVNSRRLASDLSMHALCIDRSSGKLLHNIKLFQVDDPGVNHTLNSYASPTPVLEEGRLYCHFGTYGNACVDTESGKILWTRTFPLAHGVGPGSSPIIYKNLLVLVYDGMDQQYIIALDKRDGKTAWKTKRPPIRSSKGDMRKSFSTPLVVNDGRRDQMIIPGAQWVISYDPATGKEIWRFDHGSGFSLVARPVVGNGMVYISTGFARPTLKAIRTDGQGDVTESHLVWEAKKQIPLKSSPLLVGKKLYTISDSGIATCFDAITGKTLWMKRIGGNYSASPLWVDGNILLCSHEGKTTIFKPGIEYEQIAENQLDGQLMASPVPTDNALLLRTDKHLYRIGK